MLHTYLRLADPNLKYISQFEPAGSIVYLVEDSSSALSVVKIGINLKEKYLSATPERWNQLIRDRADNEARVLPLLEGRDHVVQLEQDYGIIGRFLGPLPKFQTGGARVIRVGYIAGKHPSKDTETQKLLPLGTEECEQLEETVRNLHREGIAHHDLHPYSIILASDGPYIIDFGIAVLRNESAQEKFQTAVDDDLKRIEDLYRPR